MDQARASLGRWRRVLASLAPPPGGRLAASLQHLRSRLWLVAVLLAAWGIYVYFVSAGGLHNWPVYGVYLDLQGDGFRSGHTFLPISPASELVRASDPYDRVNIRYWSLDLSYLHGKYYSYWGPMPALVQAAVKTLLGVHRVIGDQYIGLFSACLTTLAGALIIERMGRRLFGAVPRMMLALGVLAFACANPMLHNVATTGTYQSAILAGQAWLIPGLLFAFDAVWHAGTGRARRLRLLLAGLCWGFSLASRVTVLPTVAFLIAVTAVAEGWVSQKRRWRTFTSALWLGLPVAASGVALLAYNKARFGSPFEFGLSLQLSGYPRLHFSAKYALANLYSYSLRPFVASCQFPYLYQVWWMKTGAFPDWFRVPADYMTDEPVIGWLRAVPVTWFLGFAFLFAPRRLELREGRMYLWCLVSFAAVAVLTGLTAIGVYGATMRYLSDVTPGLVLLGLLGALALRAHRIGRAAPKLTTGAFSVLATATLVMGLLIGYQGYNAQFHKYNAELDAKLVKTLSFCGNADPGVPRFWP